MIRFPSEIANRLRPGARIPAIKPQSENTRQASTIFSPSIIGSRIRSAMDG
jgi:hypothetical protein